MKKIFFLSILLLNIYGCTWMNTSQIMTREGVPIYEARCDGTFLSFSSCLKYAYNTCNQSDFQIIYNEDEIVGASQNSTIFMQNSNNPIYSSGFSMNKKRSIIFFCEKDYLAKYQHDLP